MTIDVLKSRKPYYCRVLLVMLIRKGGKKRSERKTSFVYRGERIRAEKRNRKDKVTSS
jgi:hypothetical protein